MFASHFRTQFDIITLFSLILLACSTHAQAESLFLFNKHWQPGSQLDCHYTEDNGSLQWSRCNLFASLQAESQLSLRLSHLALEGEVFSTSGTTDTVRDSGIGAAIAYRKQLTPNWQLNLSSGVVEFDRADSIEEFDVLLSYYLAGGSVGLRYERGGLITLNPAIQGHLADISFDSYALSDWRPWGNRVETYIQYTGSRLSDNNDLQSLYFSYQYTPFAMRPLALQLSSYNVTYENDRSSYYSPELDFSLTSSLLNEHDINTVSAVDYQLSVGRSWSRIEGVNEPATTYRVQLRYLWQFHMWRGHLALFSSSSNRDGSEYRTKGGDFLLEIEF